MDAKELTKKWFELEHSRQDMEKRVKFLEMENEKLRTIVSDLGIDLQMLQQTVERMRNA